MSLENVCRAASCLVVISACSAAMSCSTGEAQQSASREAPLTGGESKPEKSPLERLTPHPFWPVFTPRALPERYSIDDVTKRVADPMSTHFVRLPEKAQLELWRGGEEVTSTCALKKAPVVEATSTTVTLRMDSQRFHFFPTLRRETLPSNKLRADTLVYDDRYAPFAYAKRGCVVSLEGGQREGLSRVCLDPPACKMRGWVRSEYIGQAYFEVGGDETSAHDFFPEETQFIWHHTGTRVTLTDKQGRVLLPEISPMSYHLISREGDRAEVVIFSYDIETSVLPSATVAFHGYIDANLIPPPPDEGEGVLGGYGMGMMGRGSGSGRAKIEWVYLHELDWIFASPDENAPLAMVRNSWAKLRVVSEATPPDGWIAVTIETPWHTSKQAYVRERDVSDQAPDSPYVNATGETIATGSCAP